MNEKSTTQQLRVQVNGLQWSLYSADYKADAGTYSLTFYAINDEHAHAIVQDIRETLTFSGQVIGRTPA